MTHVHSRDPRKRAICDALRAVQGLPPGRGRVTCVKEDATRYSGTVFTEAGAVQTFAPKPLFWPT